MSCSIVSHAHIDAVIDVAKQFDPQRVNRIDRGDYTRQGRGLIAENVRSYNHRYQDSEDRATLDETYVYRGTGHKFTPSEALAVIDCYNYQLSEYDGYDRTDSARFVAAVRESVIRSVIPRGEVWEWNSRLPALNIGGR